MRKNDNCYTTSGQSETELVEYKPAVKLNLFYFAKLKNYK